MRIKATFNLLVLYFLISSFNSSGQTPADVYRVPLSDVLSEVEKAFGVKISYDSRWKDIQVEYATWRLSSNLTHTLDNILYPLGLGYRETGDNTFRVTSYEYFRRSETEAKKHLDILLSAYSDAKAFEQRKVELRQSILTALRINYFKKRSPLNVIKRDIVKLAGYTVQNVAFESIPGYFVTGTLYMPVNGSKPFPIILSPNGHFYGEENSQTAEGSGRYGKDVQYRCAALAKMGAVVFNYDMYSWGESVSQSGDPKFHETGFSQSIQTWNSIRALDFLVSLPDIDTKRVGITGASGGGTQTFLLAALDERVTVSVPVVMVSSSFYGGCPCESGLPIHNGSNGHKTNNTEIAALLAPKPQLIVSDGADWTRTFPILDYPYLKRVYGFYGEESKIENVHLPHEGHDYGLSKRAAMYDFFAKEFRLNVKAIQDKEGNIDESTCTIQNSDEMHVFGKNGGLPTYALQSHQAIMRAFENYQNK
jgi:dienelactone hydrolase